MSKIVFILVAMLAGSMTSGIGSEADGQELVDEETSAIHGPSSLGGYVDGYYIEDIGADRSVECTRRQLVALGGSDREWRLKTPAHIRARYNCASAEPIVLSAP